MAFPVQFLFLAFLAFLSFVSAESTTTSSSTTSTSTATASIYPGTAQWTYYGCWNETTTINNTAHLRALSGTTESLETMTVQTCLDFCGASTYAGLEYTKECYCSQYISAFSAKLNDSMCNLPCVANSSQICGGSLRLTVYQQVSSKSGAAAAVGMGNEVVGVSLVVLVVGGLMVWG